MSTKLYMLYDTHLPYLSTNYLSVDLSTYIYIFYIHTHIYIYIYIYLCIYIYLYMGASINMGIPKWMVMENPTNMNDLGVVPISGNLHRGQDRS